MAAPSVSGTELIGGTQAPFTTNGAATNNIQSSATAYLTALIGGSHRVGVATANLVQPPEFAGLQYTGLTRDVTGLALVCNQLFDVSSGIARLATLANGGASVRFIDNLGNYKQWNLFGESSTGDPISNYYAAFIDLGSTADTDTGCDLTNIVTIRIQETHFSGVGRMLTSYAGVSLNAGLLITGGELGSYAKFDDFYQRSLSYFDSLTFRKQGTANQFLFCSSLVFDTGVRFISQGEVLEFYSRSATPSTINNIRTRDGYIKLTQNALGVGDFVQISDGLLDGAGHVSIDLNGATGNVNTIESEAIRRFYSIRFGADWTLTECTIQASGRVDANGSTFTGCTFRTCLSSDGALHLKSTTTLNSCFFSNNTNGPAIYINQAGIYDLSGHTFSGNTLNVRVDGVAAILELSAAQFASYSIDPANFPVEAINAGSVTVTGPLVALAAPNFANGTRFFAARQQTFAIQSADINTTQNTITLGNDDENGVAFARQTTSPATLMLLTLAAGATIPTSSPQIVDGNLYYVLSNTSGVVQISETEGGTAINFTTTGTQNGSGELFSLRCETELINQVVSGGAGVSQSLTLPNDAILNVAAIHRASASSCSTLFERQLQWSATTGATIPDTFSATNNPDTIHNALVGATIRSKSGLSVSVSSDGATVTGLAFDLSGNIELDANAITDNTMSFPDGYLWAKYVQSLQTGIRFIRNQFSAVGIMDYRFDKLRLDNVADGVRNSPATTLTIYGNVEPTIPGQSVIASGSGTVHIIPFYVSDIESSAGGGGDATAANQTAILNALAVVDGLVDSILEDTSTALPSLIGDMPTVAEFEARTLPSADYFVVGDYTAPPDISGLLTTSTYAASLPDNFWTLAINDSGHLSRVTLVDTTTTNTDMRGTDGAITSVGNVTVGAYASGQSPADLVSGFATPGNVTDAQAAIISHGDTNWATADVSAILEDTSTNIPALIGALPTVAQVQAAGFTSTRHNALVATESYTRPMAKQLGLVAGITATHAEAGITVSDGDGTTTITDNGDGSYTVEGA